MSRPPAQQEFAKIVYLETSRTAVSLASMLLAAFAQMLFAIALHNVDRGSAAEGALTVGHNCVGPRN